MLDGFTVREALEALKDHHDGDDARRDRAAALGREQVGEALVGKESMPLVMKHPVDGSLAERLLAEGRARAEEVGVVG